MAGCVANRAGKLRNGFCFVRVIAYLIIKKHIDKAVRISNF
jgi:hypothetical protein